MRDKSLDILKGLACILMIFAHSKTLGRTIDTPLTEPFWYLGFFAPVLFFASVGVSLHYQLKKRGVFNIVLFNLILFLISFGDRGREALNYISISQPNLIASLALAGIFTVMTKKINGLLMLLTLVIFDRLLNKFSIEPTIFYGLLFSIIPWAGLTTLGKFLIEKPFFKIYLLTAGILITFYCFVIKQQIITDQSMTTLFLGLSISLYSASAILSVHLEKIKYLSQLLVYLGKNTLLFYWIHLFILFTINFKLPAVLMWTFILITSLISMIILKRINKLSLNKISSSPVFWIILVISAIVPSFLKISLTFNFYFLSLLTIIFALNYHNFYKIGFFKNK